MSSEQNKKNESEESKEEMDYFNMSPEVHDKKERDSNTDKRESKTKLLDENEGEEG